LHSVTSVHVEVSVTDADSKSCCGFKVKFYKNLNIDRLKGKRNVFT